MKINWIKMAIASCALVLSGMSSAGVITDTESVDVKLNTWQVATWTHDLTDNAEPFSLGSAISGMLSIEFWDDERDLPGILGGELATIVVGSIDFLDGSFIYSPTSDWSGSLGLNSLASLNSSGLLSVKVWSDYGDFYIGKSTLSVITSDVPEPSGLLLLGLGMFGLAVLRRRKA